MSAFYIIAGIGAIAAIAAIAIGSFFLARNIEKKKTLAAIVAAKIRLDSVRVNTVRGVTERMRDGRF